MSVLCATSSTLFRLLVIYTAYKVERNVYNYTRAVLRLECSLDCLSAPTYRYIAPRMIQRIILKFCGYVGCDDATNVSNFGYEPIKFNQLNQ